MTTPDAPLPVPQSKLDRTAVERVLARAAELQSAGSGEEPEGELSEAQLLELGREVGLAPEHLRQALAEERTRLPAFTVEEHGLGSRVIGPGRIATQRVVPGTPRDVLAAIDAWMQREECLQPKRQFADRATWEARRDLVGTARRVLAFGRVYALARAEEVGATAIAVDERRVLVRLEADMRPYRTKLATQGFAVLGVGGAAAGAMAIMGFAVPVLAIPVVLAGAVGYAGAREMHHRVVSRAQLALEQLLDRLERGDVPRPSLMKTLADVAAALPPRRLP